MTGRPGGGAEPAGVAAGPGSGGAVRCALRWRPAPRARRLATVALAGLLAALATGQARLLLLAAPPVAVLAAAARGARPGQVEVSTAVSATRCFEGEQLDVQVTASSPARLDEITVRLAVHGGFGLTGGAATQSAAVTADARSRWSVRARRWGRHQPGTLRITCRNTGGLWQAEAEFTLAAVEVFPAARARAALVPLDLLRRIGEHAGRATGSGVEFAGLRPYLPGDRLRDINWRVTSRRGELHVNQRAAERATDLVVMVDAFAHAGPPGAGSLDLAVRGAAALAHAYLRSGDRVGVVVLGGVPRWLAPGASSVQFYRIVQAVLDVQAASAVTPDLGRIPRTALPPGALVVTFTPLLDDRAVGALTDLRDRRFAVVVVDVLHTEPALRRAGPLGPLALRLWRLDRAALRSSLARLGIPVITWDGSAGLDAALAPLRRAPLPARRP